MKAKPDAATQGFFRELYQDTKELYRLSEHGIAGAASKIKDPEYSNGNGNEYVDFPGFYQMEGVHFLLKEKRILLADGMGVGKTAQAVLGKLEIENSTGKRTPTLVVTPSAVRDHWFNEIHQYCEAERAGKVVVLDEYTHQALENIKDADFVIVNYEMFGNSGNGARRQLADAGFNYVVLDEVHNIKNPDAVRSGFIKDIADRSEYLCQLSGTPIPNRLEDIYMVIALLEKDAYKDAQAVMRAHWNQPRLLRVILERRRLRRDLSDIIQLPELSDRVQNVELNELQRAVYDDILNNYDLEGTSKLQQLRYALLDPSLVNPAALVDEGLKLQLRNAESSKYKDLDGIIRERAGRGEKVVVYSPTFQAGVTQKLAERYKAYGALVMDGTNAKDRESIRRTFQHSPENSVLIATDVAGEGITMTSGSTVVFLDNPYAPGERQQMIKRVHRRGQKNPVDVITLSVPGTVDEGVVNLLEQKEDVIRFMENGAPLSQDQKELIIARSDSEARPISRYLYTPQQKINRWAYQMCALGAKRTYRSLKKRDFRIARDYAENYVKDWETSVSANTGRLYKWIIEQLESQGKLDRKVDLGSGPGVLSKVTGEKTVNTDLNFFHFKQDFARKDNHNVVSSLHQLPFMSELYDLAVCSNSLNDTSLEQGGTTEREQAIREANRILKEGGYYVLTLPRGVITEDQAGNIQTGLQHLGFEIVPEFTGFAKSTDAETGFNVYVATARKTGAPSPEPLNKKYLELVIDDRTVGSKEKKRRFHSQRKRGVCTEFVIE